MRCNRVRELIEENQAELSAEAREHVERCAACAEYARAWGLMKIGFTELAEEPAPEASVGFTQRLMRRLGESLQSVPADATFFERAGLRFVYATLILAFVVLLGLALPSSGPLRSPGSAEVMLAQPETAVLQNESVIGVDGSDSRLPAQGSLSGGAAQGK